MSAPSSPQNTQLKPVSIVLPSNTVASKVYARKTNNVTSYKTTSIGQNQGSLANYQSQQNIDSIMISEDETDFYDINLPADMNRNKVVKIIIYDNDGNYLTQSNFVINQMRESSQETVQIVQGFEQFLLLFFNPAVSSISFGGLLINDKKYDQYNSFQELYNTYLKGSVNVFNNYSIYIKFFNNQYVRAAFVNLEMSINAQTYELIPMSFSVIVLERYFMTTNQSTGQTEMVVTVDYQDTALQLQDPNLTQDDKDNLIMPMLLDMNDTFLNMDVNVIQATPTSLVVTFSQPATTYPSSANSSSMSNSSSVLPQSNYYNLGQ